MSRNTKGFTLLELMIVIAIIGILVAIAVPSYLDYTVRAKVSEGLQMAASAKTAVAETYHTTGQFPASNSAAGLAATQDLKGNYVKGIAVGTAGVITITYNTSSGVSGSTVVLTPTANTGTLSWSCKGGTIESKYLPAQCR